MCATVLKSTVIFELDSKMLGRPTKLYSKQRFKNRCEIGVGEGKAGKFLCQSKINFPENLKNSF